MTDSIYDAGRRAYREGQEMSRVFDLYGQRPGNDTLVEWARGYEHEQALAEPFDISKVTEEHLEAAAATDDLDAALYPLQKAAGIHDGDVAGVMFCGEWGECWPTASRIDRLAMLRRYLSVEKASRED